MPGKRRHRGQSARRRGGAGGDGPGGGRTADRKTLQLCGQVRKALDYVLSGETGDDLLRGLYVADVVPAPDASRLLATVAPIDPRADLDAAEVLEKLGYVQPMLRGEVARSINRKKVPDLTFTLAGPPPGALGGPAPDRPEIGEPEPRRRDPRESRGPKLDPAALLAKARAERDAGGGDGGPGGEEE